MTRTPVSFDVVEHPATFDRAQLALRIALTCVLGILGASLNVLSGFVYLVLPIVVAVLVSSSGSSGFIRNDAPRVTRFLHWVMAVSAYFSLLTDRFALDDPGAVVRFDVQPTGTPTVGRALARLVTTIPALFVLAVLWIPGAIVWLVAAIAILFTRRYPEALAAFLLGLLRYQARLLAYHASLVDRYPPFAFDTGAEPSGAAA